jgi:lipopolysaccharide assembly outer membrane protein LptD (OstA)
VAVGFRRFGAEMAGNAMRLWMCLVGWLVLGILLPYTGGAAGNGKGSAATTTSSEGPPLDITATRIDYLQDREVYEADGSVVVNQGTLRLTADHMTIQALPGIVIATGHVRLTDPKSDLVTERLELNVNTEAGVITHGRVHLKATNTSVEGRLIQRFSDEHYRVKEGRITNCDAQEGETPAWRFEFKDLDLHAGDKVAFTDAWLCVNDVRVIPLPKLTYPLDKRRTGFLIPTVGYNNRFGMHLQESFFWAINPSQDLTVSPFYYSKLGYGSDFKYRYVLDEGTGCAADSGSDHRDPYTAIHAGLVGESESVLCNGLKLAPAIEQLGSRAGSSQRRIESLGEPAAGLWKHISARSIPAAVAIGRIGYVSASAGSRLQSPEQLLVQFADLAGCGYEFCELLS